MPRSAPLPPEVRRSLRETFGVTELRAGQREVIGRVLAGQDTLAVMPTGAGKSLCYQLPALHLEGTTIVVSPLISLMKDQAGKLEEAGVPAEQLNSALPVREQDASLERLADAESEIVFATPERLADPEFRETMSRRRVALVAIDEAHCISQWGHDFRPAYLEIGSALEAFGRPPVLALTATATADVVEDIRRQLGRPRMALVDTGMYRANLWLQALQAVNEDEKFERLREALGRAQGSGIVYTSTVKAATELHERLSQAGEPVTLYHGRLPAAARHAAQDAFMGGAARVMVATNAFGMGIDKPDIRFVIHWQLPGSPQAYYQEAGRAGRDGARADCVLIFHRKDRQVQQFFLARKLPGVDELRAALAAVEAAPATSIDEMARRAPGLTRTQLAVCLSLLREGGLLRHHRDRGWLRVAGADDSVAVLAALAAQHERKRERDHEALERMVFYAQTGFCRWRVLLEAFDEPLPFADGHCGHCDNCLRPPAASPEAVAAGSPASPADAAPDAAGRAGRAAARRRGRPVFEPGAEVRVPRHGEGRVVRASADEVTVSFPDGAERSFVAAYVKPARPRA